MNVYDPDNTRKALILPKEKTFQLILEKIIKKAFIGFSINSNSRFRQQKILIYIFNSTEPVGIIISKRIIQSHTVPSQISHPTPYFQIPCTLIIIPHKKSFRHAYHSTVAVDLDVRPAAVPGLGEQRHWLDEQRAQDQGLRVGQLAPRQPGHVLDDP